MFNIGNLPVDPAPGVSSPRRGKVPAGRIGLMASRMLMGKDGLAPLGPPPLRKPTRIGGPSMV